MNEIAGRADSAAPGPAPGAAAAASSAAGLHAGPEPAAVQPSSRRTPTLIALALALVAVLAGLWFRGFGFHTWMGDDVYLWASLAKHPSFHELLLTASGGKYRPVTQGVLWLVFQAFRGSFAHWVYFNVGLEVAAAWVLFFLVRRVAKGDLAIAFAAAVLFVTSRFSYYNVFQAMGTMEALCILLLIAILFVAVVFWRSRSLWPAYVLAALYLAISLTHERYLALFPFLALLALLRRELAWRVRGLLVGLFLVPPVLFLVLKEVVFRTTVLMGTGGQAVGFDPGQILRFMEMGLANMAWINWGPDYLSGIALSEAGPKVLALVVVIGLALLACIVFMVLRVVRCREAGERREELKLFVLWLALLVPLLFVASITIRQEYRWLYAPFVVTLVYFAYQYARLPWKTTLKYVVLAALCVLLVTGDAFYRRHETGVFFVYGEAIADSAYQATVGRYGPSVADKTIYVEKTRDVEWLLAGDLFLTPYFGLDHRNIVWADDFAKMDLAGVDPAASVFLRMDWTTGRFEDVTAEVLGGK